MLAVLAIFAGLRMAAFGSILLAILTGGQVLLAYSLAGSTGQLTALPEEHAFRNADLAGA